MVFNLGDANLACSSFDLKQLEHKSFFHAFCTNFGQMVDILLAAQVLIVLFEWHSNHSEREENKNLKLVNTI
jgi:hypothetical protein